MTFEFQRLVVYERARQYNEAAAPLIARVRRRNPSLARQLENNGSSITANIAEGAAEDRPLVKANHYRIAKRETEEAAGHWETAVANGYVARAEIEPLHAQLDEIARMLFGLVKRFDARPGPSPRPAPSPSPHPRPRPDER